MINPVGVVPPVRETPIYSGFCVQNNLTNTIKCSRMYLLWGNGEIGRHGRLPNDCHVRSGSSPDCPIFLLRTQTEQTKMTTPTERINSIVYTEQFLLDLIDPKKTSRVPKEIRERAMRLLRHYPTKIDLDIMLDNAPKI